MTCGHGWLRISGSWSPWGVYTSLTEQWNSPLFFHQLQCDLFQLLASSVPITRGTAFYLASTLILQWKLFCILWTSCFSVPICSYRLPHRSRLHLSLLSLPYIQGMNTNSISNAEHLVAKLGDCTTVGKKAHRYSSALLHMFQCSALAFQIGCWTEVRLGINPDHRSMSREEES